MSDSFTEGNVSRAASEGVRTAARQEGSTASTEVEINVSAGGSRSLQGYRTSARCESLAPRNCGVTGKGHRASASAKDERRRATIF